MPGTDGIYFAALNVGVPQGQPADYGLNQNGYRYASISRSDAYGLTDTIGRELAILLNASDTLHVSTAYHTFSDYTAYTSFALFSIHHTMQPFPAVFSVARRNTVSGHLDPLVFNVELVNEGGHFDTSRHLFIAPTAGIYYFSVSVGLAGGFTAHVELQKNNQAFVNVIRNSTVHPGTDTTSRSILMSLEEGDTIHLVNHADQVAWSTETGLETSFSGFLYQPLHGNMVFFL